MNKTVSKVVTTANFAAVLIGATVKTVHDARTFAETEARRMMLDEESSKLEYAWYLTKCFCVGTYNGVVNTLVVTAAALPMAAAYAPEEATTDTTSL